jgi:hypothetical protein
MMWAEISMQFGPFAFGSIQIDGVTYGHDVVVDHGEIRKRRKKPSKKFRDEYAHTPLSAEEEIPWKCRRLVIGTGAYGSLPVMKDVKAEAERRKIELIILSTEQAIKVLGERAEETNAILHVTC